MEVKFIKCTKAKLSNVPVVDGQLIALTDSADVYYDMSGSRTRCCSYGTATNYGLVTLSDSYTTSAGAASASVAASSKALSDAYNEINSNLTMKIKASNTGVEVRYDNNWVNIRFVLQQYTVNASWDLPSYDITSVTLPEGISVNYDLYTMGIFMNVHWRPLSHTVSVIYNHSNNSISLSTAQPTDHYVLAYDHTFPRSAFTITD